MNDPDKLRALIAASLWDFIIFMCETENPIIVGSHYSTDPLTNRFVDFCETRQFNPRCPDAQTWLAACVAGRFQPEEMNPDA